MPADYAIKLITGELVTVAPTWKRADDGDITRTEYWFCFVNLDSSGRERNIGAIYSLHVANEFFEHCYGIYVSPAFGSPGGRFIHRIEMAELVPWKSIV